MEMVIDQSRTKIIEAIETQVKYIAFTGMRCALYWLKLQGYY
jgi:hypothetical protein